jgi:hypothetical protein
MIAAHLRREMSTYQLLCFERSQLLAADSIDAINLATAVEAAESCYPGLACELWEGDNLMARTDGVEVQGMRERAGPRFRWTIFID